MNLKRTGDDMAERLNRQFAKQADNATRQAATPLERATSIIERVDAIQSDAARRLVPRPRPSRRRTVLFVFAGVGVGYLVAYFLDREKGRGRRIEVARRLGGRGPVA